MPFTENGGVKIYWEEEGKGAPVLLIMGLGWPSYMWYRTKPLLTNHYRTITFDNRGAGRSDVPAGPYPIATMASDAAAVLDAAGVERAPLRRLDGRNDRAGICAAISETREIANSGLYGGRRTGSETRRTRGHRSPHATRDDSGRGCARD